MSQVNEAPGDARAADPIGWFVSPAARHRAVEELRHLGLPEALADDVLATAAHRLATSGTPVDAPSGPPGTAGLAARAVVDAARGLLRGELPAPERPLDPTPALGERAPGAIEPTPAVADLAAVPPEDLRRAAVALFGGDPPALSAVLAVVTLLERGRGAGPASADDLLAAALRGAGHPAAAPGRVAGTHVERQTARLRLQAACDDLGAALSRLLGALRPDGDRAPGAARGRLVAFRREGPRG